MTAPDPRIEAVAKAFAAWTDPRAVWEEQPPAYRNWYLLPAARLLLAADAVDPLRQHRPIETEEELDALPVGTVVLSKAYQHHVDGVPVSFQRWPDGRWYRGARSSDTHPDVFLPAIVLHEPTP